MTASLLVRRAAVTGSVLAVVSGAFAAGYAVAGDRVGGTTGAHQPPYRLTAAGLDAGLSCDRLRSWYVDHGVDSVTAWGWQGSAYRTGGLEPQALAEGEKAADSAAAPSSPGLDTQTGSRTGTNVQEAGVDEPDVAKVSGDLLVRISGDALKTDDVSGAEARRLGVAPLGRIGDPHLLVSGDRAVVLGSEVEDPAAGAPAVPPPPRTWVATYDLSDPTDPTLVGSRLYDGSLVSARQAGSTIRLVLESAPPALDFEQPSGSVTTAQALAHNREVVRRSAVSDWLPQVTTYDALSRHSDALVGCGDVAVPETYGGLGTLSVVGFDATSPADTDTTAVATASDTAYVSADHLYVATSRWTTQGWGMPQPMDSGQSTQIYGFDLSGTSARYVGMGSVPGRVAGSWSMDEHGGVLRVAASTWSSTSLVMLRPQSGRLLDVGHLDGLGAEQQLKAVRWFDDLVVLVTYRQTDPLYVVDVADPTSPRVLGELHLPGWSSYLHPVGAHLLLGLGQTDAETIRVDPGPVTPNQQSAPDRPSDSVTSGPAPMPGTPVLPRQRAKATLFDISDLAHPRDVDTVSYPLLSVPLAATQPHQVTWIPGRQTLLTVIASGFGTSTYGNARAWVSVITVGHDTLHNRMLPLPAGVADLTDVRTLPLSGGRVAIVAGDSVELMTV